MGVIYRRSMDDVTLFWREPVEGQYVRPPRTPAPLASMLKFSSRGYQDQLIFKSCFQVNLVGNAFWRAMGLTYPAQAPLNIGMGVRGGGIGAGSPPLTL